MKKLFLFIGILTFYACMPKPDREYYTDYQYENKTDLEVTVTIEISVLPPFENPRIESFSIPSGETYNVSFAAKGGLDYRPLRYYGSGDDDIATVSNGIVQIEFTRSNGENLFDINNYTDISTKKKPNRYKFVFDNDYFNNGLPIE